MRIFYTVSKKTAIKMAFVLCIIYDERAKNLMPRKSPHSPLPPEEREHIMREAVEQLIDHALEDLIIGHSRKVNEGNNGVIFHLDLRGIEPASLAELKRQGIELGEEQAVKVLKVYFGGNGKLEFNLQSRAYRLLEGQEGVARIPRPILYRDIQLTTEGKKELRTRGVRTEKRVEILLMEFVPGIDLATLLYREALRRRYPELYPTLEDTTSLPLSTLMMDVASALGLERPGGKGATETERAFERRKVEMANAKKLFDFLRQKGFVLPARIVQLLERTVACLHEDGMIHRDMHERNIMLTHPSDLQNSDVYLVDFGSARSFSGPYRGQEQSLYEDPEAGVVYVQDEMALRLLESFTISLNKEKRQAASVEAQRFFKRVQDLDRDSRWVQKRTRILSELSLSSPEESLSSAYRSLVSKPDDVPYGLSLLLACQNEKNIAPDIIRAVVERMTKQKELTPRERNLLVQFLSALP
jgi:serine/threonine protein kinase